MIYAEEMKLVSKRKVDELTEQVNCLIADQKTAPYGELIRQVLAKLELWEGKND